jgi:acyl-CoA hydrolase
MSLPFPLLTADEAAALIQDRDIIGFSGFTPAGAAKSIPRAIAARARAEHEAGRPFKVGVITGASTGPSLDGELAKAEAVLFRTPYQADPELRKKINKGEVQFFDMHLSMLPQAVRYGFLGKMKWAVVEACEVYPGGEDRADHLGRRLADLLRHGGKGDHRAQPPPLARAARPARHLRTLRPAASPGNSACSVRDRIGSPVVKIDPSRIVGIVETNQADECGSFDAAKRIGAADRTQRGRVSRE